LTLSARIVFASAFAFAAQTASPAQTAPISVLVNGYQVSFDQPPVSRAGRVFVPLRGVLERLGATVVFGSGRINITAGQHDISLQIGSTAVTIDGSREFLDSPPILVNGRALVPLRFVSQALGASVTFVAQTQTAYVTQAGAAPPPPVPPAGESAAAGDTPPPVAAPPSFAVPPSAAAPPADGLSIGLLRVQPPREASLAESRPEISAAFSEEVDASSLHLSIDGSDVTAQSYVSAHSVSYTPEEELAAGSHEVVVEGRTADHVGFTDRWSFQTTGTANTNYISGLEPPNGTPAGQAFTVSAITEANAVVEVVATTNDAAPTFNEALDGSTTAHATADGSGYFAVRVVLPQRATSILDVRVTSTAPDGNVVTKTLRLQP